MSLRFNILVFGLIAVQGSAGSSAQSPTLKSAMHDKLVNAQQLLEAVVTVDYPAMERGADRLSRISYAEIASWQAVAQPEYVEQATAFLSSVQGVREAAASKNIENAASEYRALISSCVQCHVYIRRSRVVSLPADEPPPGMPRPREGRVAWPAALNVRASQR